MTDGWGRGISYYPTSLGNSLSLTGINQRIYLGFNMNDYCPGIKTPGRRCERGGVRERQVREGVREKDSGKREICE